MIVYEQTHVFIYVFKHFMMFTVGGGSAGCVLANRLSTNPKYKVLLIEAGDEENLNQIVDIPLVSFELQKTPMDWGYSTTSQEHCCGSYVNQVSIFY